MGVGRIVASVVALVPGALTVYLTVNSGGYFPGATALATLVIALVLLLRIVLADDPLEGLGPALTIVAGALLLLALWALASASWSGAPGRAVVETGRIVLYLSALLLAGSLARSAARLRLLLWGLALAMTGLCLAGLATRTMPDWWPLPIEVQLERLAYPLGYWNALGFMAALATLLCLHLASDAREPRVARVLGAAAIPALAATLLFTFSRGPILVIGVGLVLYAFVGRPRLLPSALLAVAVPAAIAIGTAYGADLLASGGTAPGGPDPVDPRSPAAVAQGHAVLRVIALCVLGAATARGVLLLLDPFLDRVRLPAPARRYALAAGIVTALVLASVLWVRFDASDRIAGAYQQVVEGSAIQTGDRRDRLLDPGLGRLDLWRAAMRGYHSAPLIGHGAGTFEVLWARHRPTDSDSYDAHSLFVESLGELGVVGLGLLTIVLATLLVGTASRARARDRAVYAVVLAGGVMWVLNAAVDWFWELPAVTVWLFAAGGAALAVPPRDADRGRRWTGPSRALAGLGCVALATTPALLAVSQARLGDSVGAYERGNCDAAIDSALASVSALPVRPEPYQLLARCDARKGLDRLGARMMQRAVERDPESWRLHHGLALLRARAGLDPRAAARRAVELNPREREPTRTAERFEHARPRDWPARARTTPLDP